MQSKNQVVILGISIFEKWNRTIESKHSADRVRKKRLPSYFADAAWISSFILYFIQCSGCVQSKNGVDLVEVSIFYKSEMTSGHTVGQNSSAATSSSNYFCSFCCTLDISSPKTKLLRKKVFKNRPRWR